MLRFAFRSPYEHRIAPSRREGGGEETWTRVKKLHNATQFRYKMLRYHSTYINVVVGQG